MVDSTSFAAHLVAGFCLIAAVAAPPAPAVPAPVTAKPNLRESVDRPLRYAPDGHDFVIHNGAEFFNRPLYGSNRAFRADAGDRPELSLYTTGRGGNVRFGIITPGGPVWLHDASEIEARYRPGAMLYAIRDPKLGAGVLRLSVQGTRPHEGVIARVELSGAASPVELLIAYGGANGARARRNGDIGTERVPIREFFQLKPDQCEGSIFDVDGGHFAMRSERIAMTGVIGGKNARFEVADATHWNDLPQLLRSAAGAQNETNRPLALGRATLAPGAAVHVALQPARSAPAYAADALAALYDETEGARQAVASWVVVDTPDPYLNAAVAALNIAADATWDERDRAVMHGAVAWRSRLLGWRGLYWCDALGQHERTRRHVDNWFSRQNTDPVPDPFPPPAEASANLSRNETALHSNGDLTRSHYDMNMVAIDAIFRHLLWTGDLEYAKQVWPVIERHLAWERRLFRRTFGEGDDALPLYEAYANIWASDAVFYNGGGVAQASAQNALHHRLAARIARLIGRKTLAAGYQREAELIAQGMKAHLWLHEQGIFAEWKDLLGLQRVHDDPALWTFYHTIDAGAATRFQSWQMARFVEKQLARIPVGEHGYVLPTTRWMPYIWSTNNVVMAETAHAALAMWQAGRGDEAFRILKGAVLTSMYAGLCPGNVGMAQHFDAYRGESQRDFADGAGALSRTLIEGLFGVRPDALSGELLLRPGFPPEWERASLKHPDLHVAFERKKLIDTYRISFKRGGAMRLRLQAAALRDDVAAVRVNGRPAQWTNRDEEIAAPRVEILADAAETHEIRIEWRGNGLAPPPRPIVTAHLQQFEFDLAPATPAEVFDPQEALPDATIDGSRVRAVAEGRLGHRTVFTRVRQGAFKWWMPLPVEIRPPIELLPAEAQPVDQLAFAIRNNTGTAVDLPQWGKVKPHGVLQVSAPGTGGLVPGTNRVDLGDGRSADVVNWRVTSPPAGIIETVDLSEYFNDRVTQIFRNAYLAPRSPQVSLAVPKHGYGNWCKPAETFEVDDTGLRRASAANGGVIILPPGIPFATPGPGDEKNVLFTSRWENYPAEASVALGGRASHVYLLMAGSTHSMLSRFDNGEVVVQYADGSVERLPLRNPTTWWPIDQDYFIDDFAFRRPEAIPPRTDLKTGAVRIETLPAFKGKGGTVPGGAATVLDLPLDASKELKSLTVRSLANEIVIGLMAATVIRPEETAP